LKEYKKLKQEEKDAQKQGAKAKEDA